MGMSFFNRHIVYFITDGIGNVKIGITGTNKKHGKLSDAEALESVKTRLSILQTGNANELKILALVLCDDKSKALLLESSLHNYFSEYRKVGEWFSIKPIVEFLFQFDQDNLKFEFSPILQKIVNQNCYRGCEEMFA